MRTGGSKIPEAQQPGKSRDSSSEASRLRLACHTEVIITGKSSSLCSCFTASHIMVIDLLGKAFEEFQRLNFRGWMNRVSWVKIACFTSFTCVTYPMLYDASRLLANFLKILRKKE